MECQEIMKTDIETVGIEDKVVDAARRMKEHGVGFLPVCNERGMPLGTLTDRDIVLRIVAEGLDANIRSVVDVMTLEVVSCKRHDDVQVAADLMAQNHKSRIIVVDDDGVLCGVISLSDIAQLDDVRADETLRDVSIRESRGDQHAPR